MPNGKTQNYHLNQWEKTDQVLMEDFNADNLAIDEAIKAEADARTQADASLNATMNTELAKRGNCQMWVHTYTGNGKYGTDYRTPITFPQKPELIFLVSEATKICQALTPGFPGFFVNDYGVSVYWSGNTMTLFAGNAAAQFNESGKTYKVIALWTK